MSRDHSAVGPLAGVRVVEFGGIGPGPLAGMILADLGADVVVIERAGAKSPIATDPRFNLTNRGKRLVALDLKTDEGRQTALDLVARADAVLEGFRPGTMERLGLGPDPVLTLNPKLVYTRITGWGQTGPRAKTAGHDINYIALTGALHAIGREHDTPIPPLNLLGDYAGGTLFAVMGTVAALFEALRSGRGQVVDAAMIDGVSILMTVIYGLHGSGFWRNQRGVNLLDSGAPFYDVYRTRDDRFLAVGPLEDEFFAEFTRRTELPETLRAARKDPREWPKLREQIAERIGEKTRAEWVELFEGTDGCVAPVLDLDEMATDPHALARDAYREVEGVVHPAPAPRFSRSGARAPTSAAVARTEVTAVLSDWTATDADC